MFDRYPEAPGLPARGEIEVTSEMALAGVIAMYSHDEEFFSAEEIVAAIYAGMERARVAGAAIQNQCPTQDNHYNTGTPKCSAAAES